MNSLQKNGTPSKKLKEFLESLKGNFLPRAQFFDMSLGTCISDHGDRRREKANTFVSPKKTRRKGANISQEQCENGNVRITRSKRKLNVPDVKLQQSSTINIEVSCRIEDDCRMKLKKLQSGLSREQCETSTSRVTRSKLMLKVHNMPVVKLEPISDEDLEKQFKINNHRVPNTSTDDGNNNLPPPKRRRVLKNKVPANVEINSPRCTHSKVWKKGTRVDEKLTLSEGYYSDCKNVNQMPEPSTVNVCVSELEKNEKSKIQGKKSML